MIVMNEELSNFSYSIIVSLVYVFSIVIMVFIVSKYIDRSKNC
jgi:hypothetical protein